MEGSSRQAPAAQGSPTEPRSDGQLSRWRRVRVPTSVIVTLLVAALSVWIAPAVTRQWDDRQKERQLKAAFADEIAAASARALTAGLIVAATDRPLVRRDRHDTAKARWEGDALRISMKLTAYFGPEISRRWAAFNENMALFLDICHWARSYNDEHSHTHYVASIDEALRRIASRWKRMPRVRGDLVLETSRPEQISTQASWLASGAPVDRDQALDTVKAWLLRQTEEETAAVLATHPAGFSTKREDLIDDLLP